jgi:hypothetical protein
MKYWLEAELEKQDGEKKCSLCQALIKAPEHIFVEHTYVAGGMPHPDEAHVNMTGRLICRDCAKVTLI